MTKEGRVEQLVSEAIAKRGRLSPEHGPRGVTEGEEMRLTFLADKVAHLEERVDELFIWVVAGRRVYRTQAQHDSPMYSRCGTR